MWLAPAWLVGLVLPIALLIVSIVPSRPRDVATGTLRVWRALAASAQGTEGRRRPPLVALLGALGCAFAVLALARPVREEPAEPERWTVVVDRSPSLFLPWSAPDAEDGSANASRLERALGRLDEWAREREAESGCSVELQWIAGEGRSADRALATRPPHAPEREPDWSRWDRPGILWVSDSLPEPVHAVAIASGGAAVPGPIAVAGGRWIEWTAAGGVQEGGGYSESRTLSMTEGLPASLAALATEWAALRGVGLGGIAGARADLTLVAAGPGPSSEARLARDGWSGRGALADLDPSTSGDVWLAATDGRPAITTAPGHIRVALRTLDVPLDEAAPFAASIGGLLDAMLPPPPGVVSLDERRAAGSPHDPGSAADAAGPEASVAPEPPLEFAPWLAAAAALCALLTLGAWLRRSLLRPGH